MKFSHFAFRVFTPALLLAMPLAVAAQQAEPTAPRRGQRPGGNAQMNVQGFALGGPVGALTDQQRVSYEAAMGRQRAAILELRAQLLIAQQDFMNASVGQTFDENALRQKAIAAFRPEAEMALIKAKALSEVQPPLTAEQIEKIKAGQPGPARPFRPQQQRQLERAAPATSPSNTNTDINGLPPKK